MKIKEVEYSLETTINTGNFENLKPGFRLVAEVQEGESVKDAAQELAKKVEFLLETQVSKYQEELKALSNR